MQKPDTLDETEAKALGFAPITTPYVLPGEEWMMQNTLADMARGGIAACCVPNKYGVEVWRKGKVGSR